MRRFPHFVSLFTVLLLVSITAPLSHQAELQAEDLGQLLKAAAEDAKPESDSAKASDEKKDAVKEESNGAKKDEDTATASQAKSTGDSAAGKPKPKYPPYAEVLKEAKEYPGFITLWRKDDQLLAEATES
jgi:hypothetical protein